LGVDGRQATGDGSLLIILEIVVVSEADLEAADEVIETFQAFGVDI
jgi:hypothetical protein